MCLGKKDIMKSTAKMDKYSTYPSYHHQCENEKATHILHCFSIYSHIHYYDNNDADDDTTLPATTELYK
ncbi:hypothetical protein DERP_014506 [Dermatophagoides pteronyssinus]|uniref:Uncharacterized protein n=1 Tax=Dermatophagoides pteronyssinus TaxID=6956 RepID=A0ABQ8JUF9_DERPT|nr:hypothetical protein DERP_014506 [Dermatophagoides pteronyssinus]